MLRRRLAALGWPRLHLATLRDGRTTSIRQPPAPLRVPNYVPHMIGPLPLVSNSISRNDCIAESAHQDGYDQIFQVGFENVSRGPLEAPQYSLDTTVSASFGNTQQSQPQIALEIASVERLNGCRPDP